MEKISLQIWENLAEIAWVTRNNAYLIGETAVGAAILTDEGKIFSGCNVEHRFRINDSHAEVNAITTMVAAGYKIIRCIIVVSERSRFTPCGSCMDWIFQFGGPDCEVAYQSGRNGQIFTFLAKDLMPFYPIM
jgi:cytidine deaminase